NFGSYNAKRGEVRKITSIQNEPEGLMRNDFAAEQPYAFTREHYSARPFSQDRGAASRDGDRIRIDRDAIYRKVMAAPAALREDENFLAKLIERIRAFIARIFRAIVGKGHAVPNATVAAGALTPQGIVRDDEHEIVTDSLPESAIGSVQQSVNELIDRALGVD